MITKTIRHLFIAGSVFCGIAVTSGALTSCSDLFEGESERQIYDPALDQKTDSMFYTLGILKGLQQVADQYVLQNEMRGDLVQTNSYTEAPLRQLADFSATTECKYDSAYLYYRIINNCNYYLAHRDTTLRTGSRQVAIPEYAEALAVRAWAYLQLAKTYGKVPFYTTPLTSIEQANSDLPTKDLQGIVDALLPEMIRFSGTPVPTYGDISAGVLNSSTSSNQEEKYISSARAMLPIDVVMGDMYLETNQYELAARSYFNFLAANKWQIRQAYILPTSSYFRLLLEEKLPSSMSFVISGNAFQWDRIFSIGGTNDIISYIPLAANRLRGVTTELPKIFGFDFYSTTGGTMSSSARYLLERQIDASSAYNQLNDAQSYYYTPGNAQNTSNTVVLSSDLGDLRRYITMHVTAKNDSSFAVMEKFNNANVPIYRTATVYLRLAEAMNRMGYPDAAFAILKDGINEDLTSYVLSGDSTDLLVKGRYIQQQTLDMLRTTVPFLSKENIDNFQENWGIHSRGCYYTQGAFSPYQMNTEIDQKLAQLVMQHGIQLTGTKQDTINAMEDIICDEMALELAFEGSRFGDLTRIARHKNQDNPYRGNFGSEWLASKLAYKQPKKDLTIEDNWYLPLK